MRKLVVIAVGTMLMLGTACESGSSGGGSDSGDETVAYKLAVVGGDAGDEAAFEAVIDCIMATGIKGAETEEKVGDTLYASWEQSSQETTLLEWGQILCKG